MSYCKNGIAPKQLTLKSKNKYNTLINLEDDKLLIKLSDNYITTKKFRLPWDTVFLSDEYYNNSRNSFETNEISEANITEPPLYCVFSYIPFDSSVCSLWVTNIHAYIFSKVLNKDFQTLSEIINKVKTLLTSKSENSYERIKLLLLTFINEITFYEIIETKTCVDNTNNICINSTSIDVTI